MSKNPTEKERSWLLPAAKHGTIKAGLYLVAGPIGNLADITIRALDTLEKADGILCEDTRVSGKLLAYYGIKNKLEIYNDHSDDHKRAQILGRIQGGAALALMSDAGTPLISDPGYKLVADLTAAGLPVTSLPGANAPLTALQLSSLPSDRFSFIGFLPAKSGTRRAVLQEWSSVPSTVLAFETAPRLLKTLEDLKTLLPSRRIVVARELTKMFEEIKSGTASELKSYYEAHGLPKGEIVLVIAPPEAEDIPLVDLESLLKSALSSMSTKDAAAFVSAQTGTPRKTVYALALEITKS